LIINIIIALISKKNRKLANQSHSPKMKRESATAIFRNGAGIKVQFDAHLLTLYSLFFDLNSWAIRAKKQKI
jgi:hypothetical protein